MPCVQLSPLLVSRFFTGFLDSESILHLTFLATEKEAWQTLARDLTVCQTQLRQHRLVYERANSPLANS